MAGRARHHPVRDIADRPANILALHGSGFRICRIRKGLFQQVREFSRPVRQKSVNGELQPGAESDDHLGLSGLNALNARRAAVSTDVATPGTTSPSENQAYSASTFPLNHAWR